MQVPFLAKLNAIRHSELKLIRRLLIIKALNMSIALAIPVVATILAFAVYILTGNANNPASIFTSLTLFNLLRMPLMVLPMSLGTIADARNALNRLKEVFECETMDIALNVDPDAKYAISIQDADFAWETSPAEVAAADRGRGGARGGKGGARAAKAGNGGGRLAFLKRKQARPVPTAEQTTPGDAEAVDMGGSVATAEAPEAIVASSSASSADEKAEEKPAVLELQTLRDINLAIPRGQLTAICGPVGSGKSSLIQAMIGEMKRTRGSVTFGGSIGYAAQVAWIQNATVKENILFGRPFDEARYKSVIHDACLEADLAMLPHGDETQIGEKGACAHDLNLLKRQASRSAAGNANASTSLARSTTIRRSSASTTRSVPSTPTSASTSSTTPSAARSRTRPASSSRTRYTSSSGPRSTISSVSSTARSPSAAPTPSSSPGTVRSAA